MLISSQSRYPFHPAPPLKLLKPSKTLTTWFTVSLFPPYAHIVEHVHCNLSFSLICWTKDAYLRNRIKAPFHNTKRTLMRTVSGAGSACQCIALYIYQRIVYMAKADHGSIARHRQLIFRISTWAFLVRYSARVFASFLLLNRDFNHPSVVWLFPLLGFGLH